MRAKHPCAHRLRRRRTRLARSEVAFAARLCRGRSCASGRLDSEATKMKRQRTQEPASTSVDLLVLRECVEQFSTKTIVLLGDFVSDEFQYGEISRVSLEAPVLILKRRETRVVPGGGG